MRWGQGCEGKATGRGAGGSLERAAEAQQFKGWKGAPSEGGRVRPPAEGPEEALSGQQRRSSLKDGKVRRVKVGG